MTGAELDRKNFPSIKLIGDDFVRAGLILLTIMTVSYKSFWGYRLLTINIIQGLLILFILALFMFTAKINRSFLLISYVFLMFAWIIVSSGYHLSSSLQYLPCFLLLLIPNIHKYDIVFKFLFYAALVCAIGTILQIFYPGLITNIVIPQFHQFNQYDLLIENARQGVALTGFTYQAAVNAGFLAFGLGYIIISLSVNRSRRSGKVILALIVLFCLALTNKRAHFGFSFCAMILVYYFSSKGKTRLKRVILIIFIGILLLFFLSSLVKVIDFGVLSRFHETLQDIQSGQELFGYRNILHLKALRLFQENMLFGIGWKQFRLDTINSRGDMLDTHNIYLQLLCEVGIVGFLLFVSFFIYSLVKSIKLSSLKTNLHERTMILYALYIQLFFLFYGITGNPLYDSNYYMPYLFACAYTYSLHRALTKNQIKKNRSNRWLKAIR